MFIKVLSASNLFLTVPHHILPVHCYNENLKGLSPLLISEKLEIDTFELYTNDTQSSFKNITQCLLQKHATILVGLYSGNIPTV